MSTFFFKKNKYFFKFFLIFLGRETIGRMRACGGCGETAGEYLFAEGRSAMAGMPPPVFSDRHQDQRKKEKKKKQKEKKELLFLYYIYKRYLKDYYI